MLDPTGLCWFDVPRTTPLFHNFLLKKKNNKTKDEKQEKQHVNVKYTKYKANQKINKIELDVPNRRISQPM